MNHSNRSIVQFLQQLFCYAPEECFVSPPTGVKTWSGWRATTKTHSRMSSTKSLMRPVSSVRTPPPPFPALLQVPCLRSCHPPRSCHYRLRSQTPRHRTKPPTGNRKTTIKKTHGHRRYQSRLSPDCNTAMLCDALPCSLFINRYFLLVVMWNYICACEICCDSAPWSWREWDGMTWSNLSSMLILIG